MARTPVCPICSHENDLSIGVITCEKCGAFLTDRKATRKIVEANNKKYKGDLSVPMPVRENPLFMTPRSKFSSCSLLLDRALYTNGFYTGSRIEIFGPESCGKTTLALQIIAELQKKNATCLYIDLEGTLDIAWAEQLGVDLDNLYVSRPNSGTQAIDIIGNNCDAYDVIVLDTVAVLSRSSYVTKQQEVDANGDTKDAQDFGGIATLIGQLQNKSGPKLTRSGCTLILLNQARENIQQTGSYGIKSPGGRTLRHFVTQKIQLQKVSGADGLIKEGGEVTGFYVRAKVQKNKGAQEGGEATLEFLYGKGFQKDREYVNVGIEAGLIVQSGSWYKIDGKNVAQGFDNLVDYMEDNPEVYKRIKEGVENYMGTRKQEVTNTE